MRMGGVLATCTQAQAQSKARTQAHKHNQKHTSTSTNEGGGVLANLLNPPDRAISDGPAHLRDRLGAGNENETN